MDTQTLLNNLDIVAEAPHGALRLRDLVLQFAVAGMLVEQDSAEGTGQGIVDRGAAAVAAAVARGWARRRSVPEPAPSELPFKIPDSWVWARLPWVAHGLGQRTPDEDFTYLDVSSVNGQDGSLAGTPSVISPDAAPSRARKRVIPGTVLYSTVRPYLRNIVCIDQEFDPPPIASTAFAVLHPVPGLDPRYLRICVRSRYFNQFVESRQKGVAYPAINDGDLAFGLIPLPPAPEQHRIVAKVSELMSLCDDLEARQEYRQLATTRFRGSALHALTEAETSEDLDRAWERASANWVVLTSQRESIPQLRSSIHSLAVSGRLTDQGHEDQSATELLDEIAEQQVHLKSERSLPGVRFPVAAPSVPAPLLPSGWAWTRLGALLHHCRNGISTRPNEDGVGYPLLRISAGTSDPNGWVNIDDHKFADLNEESAAPFVLDAGDVVACRFNGNLRYVGRAAVVPEHVGSYLHPDKLIRIKALSTDHRYLMIAMNSPVVRAQIESAAATTAGNIGINGGQLQALHLPLPPHSEQVRIADRVEDLFRLCAQLDACFPKAANAAKHLSISLTNQRTYPAP